MKSSLPVVQMYVPAQPVQHVQPAQPAQQVMVMERAGSASKLNSTNSSRWTDTETKCLLELWRANFRQLRGKKRNYQEWDLIAQEFNNRIGQCSLGPRTGNQCKIRIKNLSAEYKKLRDLSQPFAYHDLMSDILENKDFLAHRDEKPGDLFQVQVTSPHDSTPPIVVTVPSVSGGCTPLNSPTPLSQHITQKPVHVAQQPLHVTRQAEVTPQVRLLDTSEDESTAEESPSEVEYLIGKRSAVSSAYEILPRKKPRKNPKPTKVVSSRSEETSVVAIMREFLEDSRKREEDLFRQILQHQREAEKRYQDFTLQVVREIGQLFKRD